MIPATCNGCGCVKETMLKVTTVHDIDEDNKAIVLTCPNGHLHCWPISKEMWRLWKERWLKE
jgi:hypothetical protein